MISLKKFLFGFICTISVLTIQSALADDSEYYNLIQDLQWSTLTEDKALELGLPVNMAGISMLEAMAIAPPVEGECMKPPTQYIECYDNMESCKRSHKYMKKSAIATPITACGRKTKNDGSKEYCFKWVWTCDLPKPADSSWLYHHYNSAPFSDITLSKVSKKKSALS